MEIFKENLSMRNFGTKCSCPTKHFLQQNSHICPTKAIFDKIVLISVQIFGEPKYFLVLGYNTGFDMFDYLASI